MRQFLEGGELAYRELETRARHACVRFRDQELPPGCVPRRADVGFEVSDVSGEARLLVSKGVSYDGSSTEIREWLETGEKRFESFKELRAWVRRELGGAFALSAVTPLNTTGDMRFLEQDDEITDMAAVRNGIGSFGRALYLDEEVVFERLRRLVIGQDDALRALAGVVVRHCARTHPKRPAVVFAVGPSGVGKTRTGEALAQFFQGRDEEDSGYQFLRLDMSEYQERHRVSQLQGSPPGYIYHGEGSELVDALLSNPRTIVLFDEIEKAHRDILRVLMNAMDAGRFSIAYKAANGYRVDCRQAIFMFTSNLDSRSILEELEAKNGFGKITVEDEVCRRRLLAAGIPSEIVGRIGRFLVYRPLSPETQAQIVAVAVREIAEEYGLRVTYIEPEVIVELMRAAKAEGFGARPHKTMIDAYLGGCFARAAEAYRGVAVYISGPPYECHPCG